MAIIQETGKRKTAIARSNIKIGSGIIYINNQKISVYANNELLRLKLEEPFFISGLKDKYDLNINVKGGGKSSQIDAIRQAIAKSLVKITKDKNLKKTFQNYDKTLLVSDTRQKETYKPNCSKARAKRQKSYR
jgi:small subunit ribosomal protein S9